MAFHPRGLLGLLLSLLLVNAASAELTSPAYDSTFWQHWGDGQAELAGYRIVYPRYGELREGTGVAIFVTETFSNSLRVKADAGKHPQSDEFPVIKLNLMQDFPTGVYDYNLMTSAFVALQPINGRAAGLPTKVSTGVQEWCGHAYLQTLFDARRVRVNSHSYFDGEADQDHTLDSQPDTVAEDALLLWARELAAPVVAPGQSVSVSMLRSLEHARLRHQPVTVTDAVLSCEAKTQAVTTPAGTFEVRLLRAKLADGMTWTFAVETEAPQRVIRWESSAGHRGELLGAQRMKYWQMNRNGYEEALSKLGLRKRSPDMP